MSSLADFKTSQEGIIDAADLLVRVEKEETMLPAAQKYANICVLASKTKDGEAIDGRIIYDSTLVKDDVQELSELNFDGRIMLFNTELTKDSIAKMQGYACTLVVLSGRTEDAREAQLEDLIVWYTQDTPESAFEDILKLPLRGAMIDLEKEGILLFSLSKMLALPSAFPYTNQIINNDVHGINDADMAQICEDAGYSFFFRATDKSWLRSFLLGGQQARSVYADKAVEYDVKTAMAQLIASGIPYEKENFAIIETTIMQALEANPYVEQVHEVTVPRTQRMVDKIQGLLMGVEVRYQSAQEVRSVVITLGGMI